MPISVSDMDDSGVELQNLSFPGAEERMGAARPSPGPLPGVLPPPLPSSQPRRPLPPTQTRTLKRTRHMSELDSPDKMLAEPVTPLKRRRISAPDYTMQDLQDLDDIDVDDMSPPNPKLYSALLQPLPPVLPTLLCLESSDDVFEPEEPCAATAASLFCHKAAPSKKCCVEHFGFLPYITDIYLHRRRIEIYYHPVNCLSNQPQITPGMRALLVEWMTKVHRQRQFCQDTLFLTVNLVDRFLVTTPISKDCFQLLGITCLLVAGKQEEIYPPEIDELLRLCGGAYSREQVKELEKLVLVNLQFDLLAPTAQFFLEHHATYRELHVSIMCCTEMQIQRSRALARYVLELSLQDYALCQFAPSLLALAALELADEYFQHHTRMGALSYGGYSQDVMEDCLSDLRLLTECMFQRYADMDEVLERYAHMYDPYMGTESV